MRDFHIGRLAAVIWLAYLCAAGARCSSADMSSLLGIGGTYQPMSGESPVRLLREFIRIEFSPRLARTVVQFEFRNEGRPQTVVMGFPEQVMYERGRYQRFRAEADGWPLAARPTPWVAESSEQRWARWWVSKVHFARGERRIIRVRYQEPPGIDETDCYVYRYLFGTGRSWKGSIGSVQVLMILKVFPLDATVTAYLRGATRHGDRIAWQFQDWEPDEDVALDVAVSPYITDIVFDGHYPSLSMEKELNLRHGHLAGHLRSIADWAEGSLAWSRGERTGFIHRRAKTLALTVDSTQALLLPEKREIRLPFAAYIEHGLLRVPVRAVWEALGFCVDMKKDAIGNWSVRVCDPQKHGAAL